MRDERGEAKCTCESTGDLIFACAGGSNCGQLTNRIGVELERLGRGKLYCLAGIGAHESAMIETAKAAQRLIVLDGCSLRCAKKTLNHAGLEKMNHVVLTDLGLKKTHDLDIGAFDISLLMEKVAG